MYNLLEKVKIIDLTNLLPGPFSTLIFAELGAEVIKIEIPGQGDLTRVIPPYLEDNGTLFMSLNRNKKSMTLNLKEKEGQEILHKLIQSTDVLIEGFRPDTAKKLGLSYEALSKVNPKLIQVSLTGFGQNGPYRDLPGHDLNYMGYTGLLSKNPKDVPPVQIADISGSFWVVMGVLSALYHRERHPEKKGMYIDLALADCAFSWLNTISGFLYWLNHGFEEVVFPLSGFDPYYRTYETKDGKYITFAAIERKFWVLFCQKVGKEEWIDRQMDPDMHQELEAFFRTKTRQEWVEELSGLTCVGPVLNLYEASKERHFLERGMIKTVENIKYVNLPLKFYQQDKMSVVQQPDSLPPKLGEHTEEILTNLGYSSEEIEKLRKKGVI